MEKPGEKILLARKAKGWSQEKLAEEAGINLRTLQRIEKSETNPHGDTLHRISKALSIPLEELVNYGAEYNMGYIKAMHFSALVFVVLPLGNIMLPLIFWLIRKNDILHISYFAKNLLNFQLTWTILVCFPFVWKLLCHVFNIEFSVIPYILSPWTFIIFHFFFLYLLNATYLIIVGSIVSKKPKNYFPISIRFIK